MSHDASHDPKCTGPFSDAFDCPVHDPRKQSPPPAPSPDEREDVIPRYMEHDIVRRSSMDEYFLVDDIEPILAEQSAQIAALQQSHEKAMRTIAGCLSPENQNVVNSDLVGSVRDMAQVYVSAKDNAEEAMRQWEADKALLGIVYQERDGQARAAQREFARANHAEAERDEARAIANWCDDAACGLKVSDFALSFTPVRRVEETHMRALRAEAERATLAAQVRGLQDALTALLAHEWASACQECGIGKSEAWTEARAAIAQVFRATETEP